MKSIKSLLNDIKKTKLIVKPYHITNWHLAKTVYMKIIN